MSDSEGSVSMEGGVEGVVDMDELLETHKVEEEDLMAAVEEAEDQEYDLGHLTGFDIHPLNKKQLAKEGEKYLSKVATEGAQKLIGKIFSLPVTMNELGPIVKLPESKSVLPRWKPAPKPKAETRWEKYAKEKGIRKSKKRDRLVYDEATGEYKPRYGYGRANDDTKAWAIPVKQGHDPFEDPFEKAKMEKKQRVLKNKLQQIRNLERASKEEAPPPGIPGQLSLAEGRADMVYGKAKKAMKRTQGEALAIKKERLRKAQTSTASMGLFDKKLKGEPKRPVQPKKRRKMPVEKVDTDVSLKIAERVLRGPVDTGGRGGGGVEMQRTKKGKKGRKAR